MRYAIYFTPAQDHPLTRMAAAWLGRDAFTGQVAAPPPVAGLSPAEIAFHAAPARRYGFHATLKAPFTLAAGVSEVDLVSALDDFAAAQPPVSMPRLKVACLDAFFALVPSSESPALDALAADVVRTFDAFRAPLSEAEIERRNPDRLSATEFANLARWGYPYVMDTFRFHMTLTGRVPADQQGRVRTAIEALFAPLLTAPVPLDSVSVFAEPEAGAPFTVLAWRAFGPARARKSA
ncbi:MAG: DUF1045 domain-containing protein [Rhizobiaceae bacterium]|nr:DUF1045 domain-containing protein [Rhizobiaceae bacterium]